jgi:predicted kinase
MIIPEADSAVAAPLYPDVLVLQGIPGSGKSTWWKEYFRSSVVLSADSFFYEDGKYKFDRAKLGEAHVWCLTEFVKALQNSENNGKTIIVDNNNLTVHEVAPYMDLPKCFNRHAILLTFHSDVETCIRRQQHSLTVPEMMKKHRHMNMEATRMPMWWQHEYIFSGGTGMEEASWVPSRESL